ncbi:MAG: radical SAM protein [Bacteroidales bacterium]|nr:radical SAM protein [Bacteroidales bacterium]
MNNGFRNYPVVLNGRMGSMIMKLMTLHIIILAVWQYRTLSIIRKVLKELRSRKDDFVGKSAFSRIVFTGRKFYLYLHVPGFPSHFQVRNQLGELNRIRPVRQKANRFRLVILGITNKCPLQCRHCYEWDNLNMPDTLDIDGYKSILSKFTDIGVGQIHLGGGEPMLNYPCLLELVRFLKGRSETWIATSGLGFSFEKAMELKKAGLAGVAISVDHFDAAKHNDFRGNVKSFDLAMEATENALRAGLVTCWSVCVTRDFISLENLERYASFAASKKVHFIQIFDAMPAGRYKGQDVGLAPGQLEILDKFYLDYNTRKDLKGMPLITYHGYPQRKMGCLGSGNRYLYIDAWGHVHACPFCRNKSQINSLELSVEQILSRLPKDDCVLERAAV